MNKVQNLFTSTDLYLYTGQYAGTGTYGENKAITITFPFEPILFIVPMDFKISGSSGNENTFSPNILPCATLTSEYRTFKWMLNSRETDINFKLSQDGKTLSFYSTGGAPQQFNSIKCSYCYAAIGGCDMGSEIAAGTTYIITSSQNWKVPATGRWMLELYGEGGNGYHEFGDSSWYGPAGGASCQHYDSITLTKGEVKQIVIGDYENAATKFGAYSVNNGGNAERNTGGKGAGNRGKDGSANTDQSTFGTGELSNTYGVGASTRGYLGHGAVYLKYLGA